MNDYTPPIATTIKSIDVLVKNLTAIASVIPTGDIRELLTELRGVLSNKLHSTAPATKQSFAEIFEESLLREAEEQSDISKILELLKEQAEDIQDLNKKLDAVRYDVNTSGQQVGNICRAAGI
jgi:hypothetical protein